MPPRKASPRRPIAAGVSIGIHPTTDALVARIEEELAAAIPHTGRPPVGRDELERVAAIVRDAQASGQATARRVADELGKLDVEDADRGVIGRSRVVLHELRDGGHARDEREHDAESNEISPFHDGLHKKARMGNGNGTTKESGAP